MEPSPYAGELFGRLRAAAGDEWRAYTHHAFVEGMADGTLPEPAFRHYLAQDYLFLIQFARAYALAAYKARTLEQIRHAAAGISAIVDTEMALHVRFCKSWGLTEADMAATPEAPETMAYTRFVLEAGVAGDLLDLHVALAPCVVGYGEIGLRLARMGGREDNPYREWIETYSGEDYQDLARGAAGTLDTLMAERGGPGRMAELERIFRQATVLEAEFWQMGLRAA